MFSNLIKLVCIAGVLGGCSANYSPLHGGQRIICITAPIGSVIADDIYVSKLRGPLYVRCPINMVPILVSENENGSIPKHVVPGKAMGKVPEFSIARNGSSGAGIPSELSAAAVGRGSQSIGDGVSTSSKGATDLVKDVLDAINVLKNQELG